MPRVGSTYPFGSGPNGEQSARSGATSVAGVDLRRKTGLRKWVPRLLEGPINGSVGRAKRLKISLFSI